MDEDTLMHGPKEGYSHDNPPPGYAACTRERGHDGPCALPFKRGWLKKILRQAEVDKEREAHRQGMRDVIAMIEQGWDKQLASAVNGYRFSDMLACKLNLTRRKRPRRVR